MTAPPSYRLVPYFVVRMAGFPVELVRELREIEVSRAIDDAIDAEQQSSECAIALSRAARRLPLWTVIHAARARRPTARPLPAVLEPLADAYDDAIARERQLREPLDRHFEAAFAASRTRLGGIVRDDRFREMLLLSNNDDLARRALHTSGDLAERRGRVRVNERTWTAYLQRVTMKNDTISFFGPTVWGRVDPAHDAAATVVFEEPERYAHCAYLERWACEALFERMMEDDDIARLAPLELADDLELAEPRLARRGDRTIELSPDEALIVQRRSTGDEAAEEAETVRGLIDRGVLVRRLPISPVPLDTLRRFVARGPDSEARRRWSAALAGVQQRIDAFGGAGDLAARRRTLDEVASALRELGVSERRASRALYASRMAVAEDCSRAAVEAVIGAPLVSRLTEELAPWYELWRDLAGAYARATMDALEPVWRSLATRGAPSLASFLRAAAAAGVPLGRTGGVGCAPAVDAAIQAAWAEQLGARAAEDEVTLDDDDLTFARRKLRVRRMRAFDWPAPDVQLAAANAAALADGRFEAVLSEIHPSFVLWAHCFFWSCPDPARFAALVRDAGIAPTLEFSPSGLFDGPTHNTRHAPLWLPGWTFSGPLRVEGQRAVRSSDATVLLEDDDLVVRGPDGARVGSLIDTWLVAMNTHRLELLGDGSRAPRLRVGSVVVQRRIWIVEVPAAVRRRFDGAFDVRQLEALRMLRREHGLPEEVFVRPILATRTAHHKALKPVYVDFRSPLLCELLAVMAKQYVRLRFTEALPTADNNWLSDARGHYTCELRLLTRPPERPS